jgi:hypothetical protein
MVRIWGNIGPHPMQRHASSDSGRLPTTKTAPIPNPVSVFGVKVIDSSPKP